MKSIKVQRAKELTVKGISHLLSLDIPIRAAYAGYFLILSVFPALLLIVNSLRFTNLDVELLVEMLENVLPAALHRVVSRIIMSTYRSSTGAMAGLSLVTALWSSSTGIYGLLRGLNAVYGVSEDRGYIYTRGISILYSLGFFLVLILTLVLHVFGNTILEFLYRVENPIVVFFVDLVDLRFNLLLMIQTLLFTVMFMVLPNRRNGFLASLPGALLASLGWLTFSDIYSIYLEHFNLYANIYGGVYAVAIAMLWLYFCLMILFIGGALNALIQQYLTSREHREE